MKWGGWAAIPSPPASSPENILISSTVENVFAFPPSARPLQTTRCNSDQDPGILCSGQSVSTSRIFKYNKYWLCNKQSVCKYTVKTSHTHTHTAGA